MKFKVNTFMKWGPCTCQLNFMKACAMSAYLLQVNPFDQLGVEAYKNKMMELLK